jgi:hypothetical protein
MSMGVTSALPISEPPLAGFVLPGSGGKGGVCAVAGAGLAAGVAGAGGDFFLKKLNMCRLLRITAFYETQNATQTQRKMPNQMKRQMKRFSTYLASLFCLVAGLASSLPASAQTPPTVEQFTLANGMTLIVKPDRRAPTAVHMLWLRVGVDG